VAILVATSPMSLTRAPPELPGLIAVPAWIMPAEEGGDAHEQGHMPPGSPEPDGKRQDAGLESGWSWTLATGAPGKSRRTVMTVSDVPWWGVISSAAAPVLLVGGWTVAAERQPPSFNPVSDTVSELMAVDATDRWVMTTAFLAVGICYVITGTALRPARLAGRLILITGAVAGMLVAANPQPAAGGGSVPHAIWAALGFAGLAAWPAGAWRRGSSAPWGLRPGFCFGAVAIQLILLTWFAAEIATGAGQAGLAERVVGVDQVLCPLTVVLSCRLSRMSGSHTPKPRKYPESARFLGPSNLLPRSQVSGLSGYIITFLTASILNIAGGEPLLPLQTLWVSFTTLSIQAVGLGYCRPAAGLMDRPRCPQAGRS
jgi:hypothetical membrane protein